MYGAIMWYTNLDHNVIYIINNTQPLKDLLRIARFRSFNLVHSTLLLILTSFQLHIFLAVSLLHFTELFIVTHDIIYNRSLPPTYALSIIPQHLLTCSTYVIIRHCPTLFQPNWSALRYPQIFHLSKTSLTFPIDLTIFPIRASGPSSSTRHVSLTKNKLK